MEKLVAEPNGWKLGVRYCESDYQSTNTNALFLSWDGEWLDTQQGRNCNEKPAEITVLWHIYRD